MNLSNKTADQLRAMIADRRQQAQDSFDRCDTDGFVSQWASSITAQQCARQLEIVEAGGKAEFLGLYQGDRRVKARRVMRPVFNAPWKSESVWEIHWDEHALTTRQFVPFVYEWKASRIHKELGLSQRIELAPAVAEIVGSGTGLAGAASCYVATVPAGDEWGQDAVLVTERLHAA